MWKLFSRLRRQYPQVLITLLITCIFLLHNTGIPSWGYLGQLENTLYDTRVLLTMPGGVDTRIVIVDIDERSLAEVGRWPWSRDKLADLVNKLFEHYEVAGLGFDVVFAEPDDSSGLKILEDLAQHQLADVDEFGRQLQDIKQQLDFDQLFANSLADRSVILGFYFKQANESGAELNSGVLPQPVLTRQDFAEQDIHARKATAYGGNLSLLVSAATGGGHLTPWIDDDGVVRRVPLLYEYDGGYYESLALAIARNMLYVDQLEPEFASAGNYEKVESLKLGYNRIPVDGDIQALIPYRGYQGSFPYVSASDVLQQRVPIEVLQDAIVLVGTTAPGLFDLRTVPVQKQYPGVEVHANLIAGILDNKIMQQPDYTRGAEFVLLLGIGLLMSLLLPLLSPVWETVVAAMLLLLITSANLAVWYYANLVMPLASSLALILLSYILSMSYGYFSELNRKRQISSMFGQYIPSKLVDEMTDNPELVSFKAESRELTVLFTDIRGFTTMSEGLSPGDLSMLMNQYLTAMTRIIHEHHGTIDKYMGDAIMAFWGAPIPDADHARHALETGQYMLERLNAIREDFLAKGWPEIHIGVGINTGMMSVGDMGSEFRRAYTVLGDAVNLGSRLEGLTKAYGVEIIVSEFSRAAIADYICRELDIVKVKGKDRPVAIFEPIAPEAEVSAAEQQELELHRAALKHYRNQDWQQAQGLFMQLRDATPERKLYALYLERIASFMEVPPPDDWDGTYTFTTK